jgi:hypothetical protein
VLSAECGNTVSAQTTARINAPSGGQQFEARVTKIVDPTTITIERNGKTQTVDLIGVRVPKSGRLNYTERNLIKKVFTRSNSGSTASIHHWVGSRPSVRQLIEQFMHYYNHQRSNQSLDNRTPVEKELN